MVKAAIVGGAGYVGGELIRLLWLHPEVEIVGVASRSHAGEPVHAAHPNLRKAIGLEFCADDDNAIRGADVVFFALGHGESMARVLGLMSHTAVRVVDLGGDYRLKDKSAYEEYYKFKHTAPELLAASVYGLTEFNRGAIARSRLVACPGCFPTGALLALLPLAEAGLVEGHVVVDSKTGSTGSGAKPVEGTHHPERAHDFRAYNVFTHRHAPEIGQEIGRFAGGRGFEVTFVPHSSPMVRGIFTSAYALAPREVSAVELEEVYGARYGDEPFIRLVPQARSAVVAGSNFCDVSFAADGRRIVVNTAIDNLLKGAAGQAVQNMNVMFGLPETLGLEFPGMHP